MSRTKDITGEEFDDLKALYPTGMLDHNRSAIWRFQCRCGRTIDLSVGAFHRHKTHSCGQCGYKARRMFELNADDLTGQVFGRLTVLRPTSRRSGRSVVWVCRCSCDGKEVEVSADQLKKGETMSCGCYHRERVSKWHGEIEHMLSDRWHRIQQRCYNPHDKNYPRWGGRGIKMCEEWLHNKAAFIQWGIENGFKPGLEIDRINRPPYDKKQDGPYAPWNCRWINDEGQANNRSNNRFLKVDDLEMSCGRWDRYLGLNPGTIWGRFNRTGKESIEKWIAERLKNK